MTTAAREGFARHDLDLHRAIVEPADDGALARAWEALAFEARARRAGARCDPDWPAVAAWHGLVVDALEAGDGPAAGRLPEGHARSPAAPAEST